MEDNNEMICPCYGLTKQDLIDAIEENGITTLEELMEVTGAGTVCGACMEELEEIVENYKK